MCRAICRWVAMLSVLITVLVITGVIMVMLEADEVSHLIGKAYATELYDVVAKGNSRVARELVVIAELDPNAEIRNSGVLLYKLASLPETDLSVEIVEALLAIETIEPNGAPSAWTPLKTAIAHGNWRVVHALLEHPGTFRQVTVQGLDCTVLPKLPATVALVLDSTSPACFRSHKTIVAEAPEAKNSNQRRTAKAQGTKNSARTKLHTGTNDNVGNQRLVDREYPAPLVVDPSTFGSMSELVGYYFFGKLTRLWKLVAAVFVVQLGVLIASLYFGFKSISKREATLQAEVVVAAAQTLNNAAGDPPQVAAGDEAAPAPNLAVVADA